MYKKKLLETLSIINNELEKNPHSDTNIGVLVGKMGISIFQFHYAKLIKNKKISRKATELVVRSIEQINQGNISTNYCSGIAGFGWGMDYLVKEGFIDITTDNILVDIDELVKSQMLFELERGNYDFLQGAIGYGYYFFSRFQNTKSERLKHFYVETLNLLVKNIGEIAIVEKGCYKWKKAWNIDDEKASMNFDLGLAHGMASILNFLSRLYEYQEFKQNVKEILIGGIQFIIENQNNSSEFCFFSNIKNEDSFDEKSRIAWCYGDLGIGYTLLRCSRAIGDKKLTLFANEVLKQTADRKSFDRTFVRDACLCHGCFGNMVIFKRLFEETNSIKFHKAYNFWAKKGFGMATYKDGIAGYKTNWAGSNIWVNELSLLEGIAGIGLGIIDYLSVKGGSWQKSLMIG